MSANVKSPVGKVSNYCGFAVEVVEISRYEVEYGEVVIYAKVQYEDGFVASARLKPAEVSFAK